MGGTIGVRSPATDFPSKTDQPGSEFWFILPFKTSQKTVQDQQKFDRQVAEESIRKAGLEVLVTDDNEINRLLLIKTLEQLGVKSDVATNGEEALSMLGQKKYSMIFMDIEMPVLNGIMATQRLRENGNKTPVIACTGHAFKEELDQIMAAGMTNYLVKPVGKNDVLLMLSSLIS